MLPVHTNSTVNSALRCWASVTGTVCACARESGTSTPWLSGSTSTVGRSCRSASVGPGAADDGADGLPKDHEVEGQRPVLDVAHVDAHRVVPGEVGATADLPQAGEPGLDQEPAAHVVAVLLDLGLQRRPGADQGHLAAQHVDQ